MPSTERHAPDTYGEPRVLPLRVRISPDNHEHTVLRPREPGYVAGCRMVAYDYQRG